jgi:multicomponent Na+:H+ antiporter subunit G
MTIIGHILLVISGVFYALGGLGLVRMPDVYNRAQAGTKATTLGTFSALLAVCFYQPAWTPKVLVILVFVAITNPVGSSALLRSAYRSGTDVESLEVDALEDFYGEE